MNTITILQVIFLAVIGYALLIVTPLALYYCTIIWKKREDLFFDRRMPKLSIVCLLTGMTQFMLQCSAYIPIAFASIKTAKFWIMYGSGIVFVAEGIRAWFMYFNYEYNLQSICKEWGDAISFKAEIHWAGKGKWYSPQSNAVYALGAAWVLMETIFYVLLIIFEANGLWASIPTAIIMVGGAILAFRMKACRDDLYIQEEFKYHGVNAVLLFTTIITTDTMLDKDDQGETKSNEDNLRVAVIRMVIVSILYTVFCFISTKWLLDRHKLRTVRGNLPVLQHSNEANMKESLEHMGFELFALHLIKEHSVQHLLFLLEVSKIKAQLLKHNLIEKECVGKYLEVKDILCRIDSEVFDAESFYRNCQHVMDKYIDREGEYTVNISAKTRNQVLDSFAELYERRKVGIKNDASNDKTIANLKLVATADGATQTRQELKEEKSEAVKESGRRLDRDNVSINLFLEVIDLVLQDVWHLLENDSFARFQCTKEFRDYKNNQMDNQSDNSSCLSSIWGRMFN